MPVAVASAGVGALARRRAEHRELRLDQRLVQRIRRYKVLGGWVLEKLGRLKGNGHLLRRSPLSDLVEMEALVLGVQGKAVGFRALRRITAGDPRLDATDLDRLVGRAECQPGCSAAAAAAAGGSPHARSRTHIL